MMPQAVSLGSGSESPGSPFSLSLSLSRETTEVVSAGVYQFRDYNYDQDEEASFSQVQDFGQAGVAEGHGQVGAYWN